MSDKTGHNHWLPRAPDNKCSRAGNCFATAWHSDSTMQITRIKVMTLTSDRIARWGRGSPQEIRSTKDLDSQRQDRWPFPGALHLTREGGPRPRRFIQYDRTGRHLSEGPVPTPVSYSRRPVRWGWRDLREASRASAMEETDAKTVASSGSLPRISKRYFSLGPHTHCNPTSYKGILP
jgi:hypothetical protein